MTNKEKYGNKIIDLAVNAGILALKNGEPVFCRGIECRECDLYEKGSNSCRSNAHNFREWLNSEHVEPSVDWSKVAVDTPVLVRDSEKNAWKKRYFAKYENGIVCTWGYGATSWSADSDDVCDWRMAKLAEDEE